MHNCGAPCVNVSAHLSRALRELFADVSRFLLTMTDDCSCFFVIVASESYVVLIRRQPSQTNISVLSWKITACTMYNIQRARVTIEFFVTSNSALCFWRHEIFTGRNEVLAKVIFSQASVCPQGGVSARGVLQILGGVLFFGGGVALQIFGGGSPPEYGQRSAGTHPTGMHSSY